MAGLAIVHVTNSFRANGTGITNVVADLATTQSDRGNRVFVLCDSVDPRLGGVAADHGVRLRAELRSESPAALWRSAQRAAPLLASADVIHVHTVRALAIAALAAPLTFARASVATVHNPYQRSAAAMLLARTVVALSGSDARAVRRRSLGVRRPTVVSNGVLASPRLPGIGDVEPRPLPPDSLVFVGALTERKGVDVLLRAMVSVRREVPTAHLFVVGNRDNPAMEALAASLGLDDAVSFAGYAEDPRSWLMSAAAFVLPSRAEGFPLALLEARGCGVPIVASRAGGIPEALDGGSAGELVEAGDAAGLADRLIAVLTDPSRQQALRALSRRGAEQFSVARMADRYLEIYESMTRA